MSEICGVFLVSAFAEYAVVSRYSLVKVSSELSFEILALFGCAVMTGMGAVVNTAILKMGSRFNSGIRRSWLCCFTRSFIK